ncbi:hypothetical protein [Photobacterium damselae]|nr:hypothetical protein [Photobacterium damselae]SPY29578.1 Uncharacterised protein [Photobacterium damselae]
MNTLTKVVIASTLVTAGGQALANDYKPLLNIATSMLMVPINTVTVLKHF